MTTTLIAKRTRVGGLIETEGDVMVEGRVEGTIRAGGCVTVGVSGVAVSDVTASRALVLGILIGNVSATERIDIAASARVVGDVRAPTVSVASPGLVEGRVEELNPDEEGESKPTLRLRSGPLVRPAKPSGTYPPVVAARSPLPAPPRPPPPRGAVRETPTSELPTSPPRPNRHPSSLPARHAAPTEPAEPAPPPIPRPPGRVRLVPRGKTGPTS